MTAQRTYWEAVRTRHGVVVEVLSPKFATEAEAKTWIAERVEPPVIGGIERVIARCAVDLRVNPA